MSLGRRLSDLPYAEEDKRLLLVVANQIATFIENMKLISRMAEEERIARELKMAAEVQRHLFPVDGLEDDALEIYGTCLPALGVGGDYYDYFEMGDRRTGIAIADVAGKGNRRRAADVHGSGFAALPTHFCRQIFSRCRLFDESPASTINGRRRLRDILSCRV